MKRFVNRAADERGFTLIELIASLTLLSVVLGVIYGSITFGINAYNKISIENSLRDEGDLIMSSIMTELYTFGPDELEQLDGSGTKIALRLNGNPGVEHQLYIAPNGENRGALFIEEAVGRREIPVQAEVVPVSAEEPRGSSIKLSCPAGDACSSGLLEVRLLLRHMHGNEPMELELVSKFGF
ncbi:prepilin-type N-terminal cleavage/methylation domain-containing protein [Paenibacillus tarimensis]|uniref:prepilin-type N-terminal cleavage/methylation domain-containing protein n=1 Tax=Paenibacillus tarimensis TaxID=416012 RepID=UPI001F21EB4C|nr:prepilin-type N-terminal cleavage/methylation domain-containing protein [Paenibacillus tarimensis]MCF2943417.1 prepilin-type N-terminal cleavage/methylation domain-containing protein [Paenibacillus tarimensis]